MGQTPAALTRSMASGRAAPALIIHGGAGAVGPAHEQEPRRQAMLAAARRAVAILHAEGSALDAVVAAVVAMEDDPLFNAGFGSSLNAEGEVEMDASVMVARAGGVHPIVSAGAVAAVRRVRNPILLARAVMERTPHVMLVGLAAERLAVKAGIRLCRPSSLVAPRARTRWRLHLERENHGTVGAVALDGAGNLAAATSTGGITGKMAGRVGDSAIIGSGTYAGAEGAASATGVGEAIMKAALCYEAVRTLKRLTPAAAARAALRELARISQDEAGLIVVDRRGRVGYAHTAAMMEVVFETGAGLRHIRVTN